MKVAQSCLTLCNPMDYTVHGILQAGILEWVAVPFSRGSPTLQVDSLPAEPSEGVLIADKLLHPRFSRFRMGHLEKKLLWFDPWVGKIPWRREQLSTPVFQPGEFHGHYSPWVHKESDMTEQLSLGLFQRFQ